MYMYTKEQGDKEFFVTYSLEELLRLANKDILNVKYKATENSEIVIVTMRNGTEYRINVIGDNLMAMTKDVVDFMAKK